jgi:hypothetical protein
MSESLVGFHPPALASCSFSLQSYLSSDKRLSWAGIRKQLRMGIAKTHSECRLFKVSESQSPLLEERNNNNG